MITSLLSQNFHKLLSKVVVQWITKILNRSLGKESMKNSIEESNENSADIELASAYRLLAVNFRMSAEILGNSLECDKEERPISSKAVPFYYLASHSAELFLKAALLKRGYGAQELRKFDRRHNLSKLASELRKCGCSFPEQTLLVIESLSKQHQNHELRYSVYFDDSSKTYWPPLRLIFSMLDELLLLTRIGK
jgi:hypothetical protein